VFALIVGASPCDQMISREPHLEDDDEMVKPTRKKRPTRLSVLDDRTKVGMRLLSIVETLHSIFRVSV
jgi:hypothetical protein